MRSRTRWLSALGLSLCLGAALGLPSSASADPRDGRGWRNERHHDGDGHRDRDRHGDSRWNRDDDRRGHGYAWGHDRRGYGYRYAAHRHGPGCGHGGYAYRRPAYYGNGYRPAYYRPFWLFGR